MVPQKRDEGLSLCNTVYRNLQQKILPTTVSGKPTSNEIDMRRSRVEVRRAYVDLYLQAVVFAIRLQTTKNEPEDEINREFNIVWHSVYQLSIF